MANSIEEAGAAAPVTLLEGSHRVALLTVIGQIEGHYLAPADTKTTKYEHVIPQLVTAELSPKIESLLILLNTVGGDVEAGLALAELVSGMKKPTVSLVLGGGHSIGVPLACSAKRSFIVPSATMTIHPVRTSGTVVGVAQTLTAFQRMQDRITDFIIQNSRMAGDRFRELLLNTDELVTDMGTTLEGAQAVREGLIDRLGGLSDALDCLNALIDGADVPP